MNRQLDLVYQGGAFFPLTPLTEISDGDHVKISLLEITKADAEAENEATPVLEQAIAQMLNKSPEDAAAARARLLQRSRPPREIPAGQTLDDVIGGKWPGDETDEEVFAALEKLS